MSEVIQLDFRMSQKFKLLQEGGDKVVMCPFCAYRNPFGVMGVATQMHEIISPKGWKSLAHDDPRWIAMHQLENLILACPTCNVEWLNGQPREWVLSIKLRRPGYTPERVAPKILDIARLLKYPVGVIPLSISLPTGRLLLDLKNFTFTAERSQDV